MRIMHTSNGFKTLDKNSHTRDIQRCVEPDCTKSAIGESFIGRLRICVARSPTGPND